MDVSKDDPDLAKTVLTCEGDLRDPAFPTRLTQIICKLKHLVSDDNKKPFQVTKVEPWNSVRVTFNIPRNAAQRLRQLAQSGDNTLRELGILSVQIEGDQVITLTLANNIHESRQQLVVKSAESVANSAAVVTSSAVNNDLTVNFNNGNPISVSNDLIASPSIGTSVEITRKNIAQYLSQPHIDVVNSSAPSGESISDRVPAFLSPNVVAPINTEPIPFLNASSTSSVTQLSSGVLATTSICSVNASAGGGTRLSAPNSCVRDIQSNYGLFPFASMQHSYQAMHTKNYSSVQRLNPVIPPSVPPVGQTSTNSNATTTSVNVSVSSTITSSLRPQPQPQPIATKDAKNIKVCPPVSSQAVHSLPTQTCSTQSVKTLVAQAISQTSASANVALTSPLLVNLLQSDASSGHTKGSSVQSLAATQVNSSDDSTQLTQKRKPRKSRKSKDKTETEGNPSLSLMMNTSQSVSGAKTLTTTSSPTPSLKHLPSNSLPQQSGMESQTQAFNISPHLISIPISAMSRFPSIHPEAQGQPQVVRAGQLPLRAQLSRPQVLSSKVGSPSIGETQLRKPVFVTTSQALSSKPYPTTPSKPVSEQKSSPMPNSANIRSVTSSSEPNSVLASPPVSKMTVKTKHLINPFTGLLEPMLSDDEDEDRPSPNTLFPELDAGSDVGGNSERSLSDTGSNGKENNHSSDTDSGLGKSGTDVSSQSSIDVGNGDNTPIHSKDSSSKVCVESVTSDPLIDRLKLKVKIEAKNESLKGDTGTTCSSNSSLPSRSHFPKLKSGDSSSSLYGNPATDANQCSAPMLEPRVPPLHISIRGPNSAVVVSNRRESTSELEMKTSVSKKGRAVRSTRAVSVESGLGTECTNLNKNQRKKLQREQRFLSGGGIVTSALSVCASPPSVESIVDINQTLNDSSFALSLSTTTTTHSTSTPTLSSSSSESVDSVYLQLSHVSANCAQHRCKSDNNDENKDNDNKDSDISSNKCVPLLPNEDNSSQMCAIPVKTDTPIKTSVQTNDNTITTTTATNSSRDSVSTETTLSATAPITTSQTTHTVSVPLLSSQSNSVDNKSDPPNDSNSNSESSAPINQNTESLSQISNTNNELTELEPTKTVPKASSPSSDELSTNVSKDTSEIPIAIPPVTLVTVEPKIDAIVSKIRSAGRANCVSSMPALVTTRQLSPLNCSQTVNLLSTQTIPSVEYLNDSATDDEYHEMLQTNDLVVNSRSSELPSISDSSSKLVSRGPEIATNCKKEAIVNGETSDASSVSPATTPTPLSHPIDSNFENQKTVPKHNKQNISDQSECEHNLVKTKQNLVEINDIPQRDCELNAANTSANDKSQDSAGDVRPLNASQQLETSDNQKSVSEITATSVEPLKNESKPLELEESTESLKESLSKSSENELDVSLQIASEEVKVSSKPGERSNRQDVQCLEAKTSNEKVKQPLQIVITTTVPSLTTTTTNAVFPQLKSSTLESGSRVTLITFKPNLNSPNTSSASSGKSSDLSNSSISNQLPTKTVPFKLLTIPSGSGGITVRSAANKLVELINSTASSPVSPLSPNQLQSSGSPTPLNTTSPPVRLLVSKVATSGGVSQTGVPVTGNSIGQLVVVKSVVVTNPSPSIKLVPAKTPKTPSLNTPSLLIPVTQTYTSLESMNTINNSCEHDSKEPSHSVINNEINNMTDKLENNHINHHNSDPTEDVSNGVSSAQTSSSQAEPVDLSVQCSDGPTSETTTNLNEVDDEAIPQLIKTSETENDLSEEDTEDNLLTHSVASDHNYNMKKSSDESLLEDSFLTNSNETNHNLEDFNDIELTNEDDFKANDIGSDHSLDQSVKHHSNPRPNKRKSSENAAELIKACMGVEDAAKKTPNANCTTSFSLPSGLSVRVSNATTRTRASSADNDPIETSFNDSSETNHLNKPKNLRIRKNKSSAEQSLIVENNCLSDDDMTIKESAGLSWTNKPRLRTPSSTKNQKINKQNNNSNFIKDEKTVSRSNEKTKRGRDRDQHKSGSAQRSTRRSRDHIMIGTTGINLHSAESSSESLHMEIVGLELSNESPNNNFNNDTSSASTAPPMIASSLLVKRKTRVGIINNNNNTTEQTESSLAKRRRVVKENHR